MGCCVRKDHCQTTLLGKTGWLSVPTSGCSSVSLRWRSPLQFGCQRGVNSVRLGSRESPCPPRSCHSGTEQKKSTRLGWATSCAAAAAAVFPPLARPPPASDWPEPRSRESAASCGSCWRTGWPAGWRPTSVRHSSRALDSWSDLQARATA